MLRPSIDKGRRASTPHKPQFRSLREQLRHTHHQESILAAEKDDRRKLLTAEGRHFARLLDDLVRSSISEQSKLEERKRFFAREEHFRRSITSERAAWTLVVGELMEEYARKLGLDVDAVVMARRRSRSNQQQQQQHQQQQQTKLNESHSTSSFRDDDEDDVDDVGNVETLGSGSALQTASGENEHSGSSFVVNNNNNYSGSGNDGVISIPSSTSSFRGSQDQPGQGSAPPPPLRVSFSPMNTGEDGGGGSSGAEYDDIFSEESPFTDPSVPLKAQKKRNPSLDSVPSTSAKKSATNANADDDPSKAKRRSSKQQQQAQDQQQQPRKVFNPKKFERPNPFSSIIEREAEIPNIVKNRIDTMLMAHGARNCAGTNVVERTAEHRKQERLTLAKRRVEEVQLYTLNPQPGFV